jgi:NitT/TauT family transport system permease protein
MKHIGITLFETVAGFILGSTLGFIIAVMLWWSPLLKEVLDPYLVILNSLPKIALGPVIIVWVGAGVSSIITVTLLISIVVAIMGVLNGFNEVEQAKLTLLKTFGATKRQLFFKVVFPASIPTTVSILKLNIGMSWVGVIVGEFLNSRAGLGYLIVYGGQVFKMDIVMSSTLILCLLSALMYFLIVALEKAILKKRY